LNSLFGTRAKNERRPAGVSRRRKRQFSFETLEDRRVMSAESPVPLVELTSGGSSAVQSLSSATPQGLAAILQQELYWQSLINNGQGAMLNTVRSIPTDPLSGLQWHLINTGQAVGSPDFQPIYGKPGEDINVAPVWNLGIDGTGVTVAIVDSGVQLDHPDLAGNINLVLSFDALNNAGTGNPFFLNPTNAHGTAVAGLIGAIANNGIGGSGVAPGVSLVPIRLVDIGQNALNTSDAIAYANQDIDIYNHSWGPSDLERTTRGPSILELLALRDSVTFGRGGLGNIHVWASGNGAGNGFNNGFNDLGRYDSSNYDGYANSRYTIAVAGVDHDGGYNNVDGTVTNYMEAGANVLVAAPTGSGALDITEDSLIGSGIYTTDLTGEFGYNNAPDPSNGQQLDPFDRDFLPDTDYTSRFGGTSAAAPVVSGVIALMLQANPNLSWRDVQEILVRSARQNAQFEIPQIGAGQASQSSWIVNQVPMFHDPDLYDPTSPLDSFTVTFNPTLNPNRVGVFQSNPADDFNIGSDHYVGTPFQLTNGAGYTVSQGRGAYNEEMGYGHGVVDAQMAVQLAQQWHAKGQALPRELTFTTFVGHPGNNNVYDIPAAERGSEDSGFQIVPGGIGGESGFIAYWNEYFVDDPDFSQVFPYRGDEYMEFVVPDNNLMSIESVDVKISLSGDAAQALDHLRIMLVSPTGTQSELNNYFVDTFPEPASFQFLQATDAFNYFGFPGSTAPPTPTGELIWTFNTNRSWGERSDNAIVFDPVTGEPVINEWGFGREDATVGQALQQGWRLVIENWDANDSFGLAGVELAWHGSPIAVGTQRVQGFVGVDANKDDDFNFSRVIQAVGDNDNDPTTVRFGDVVTQIDLAQEPFAGNVTVSVRRESDGALVDQFVTGHDGNFYFDLVPDNYVITVDDPLGRVAQEDSTTPSGLLRHYQSEWHITPEHFKVWSKVPGSPSETFVDGNDIPIPRLDDNGDEQVYGMKGINFLLDPGAVPTPQATFTGTVYADVNADSVFNGVDAALPNVSVFGDVNRNGHLDAGEIVVQTDASGFYNLVVPVNSASVMGVGIVPPVQWTVASPGGGVHSLFVQPGNEFGNLNFFLKPPANNSLGGSLPGILIGSVFEDINADGQRNLLEQGVPAITVYIDANNNGINDSGDTATTTNQFGAYAFTDVTPGQKVIRVVTPTTFAQTLPGGGGARIVNLAGSSTISNLVFGIRDLAVLDYGDLPAIYELKAGVATPATHAKGEYWLGPFIDGELTGAPSANADGDEYDDGIVFGTLTSGSTASLVATPSRQGGYLQGWADWNNDGDFNDAGERIITNHLLSALEPAVNQVFFNVPAGLTLNNVFARFRYGEFANGTNAISTPWGAASTGEVEDYRLPIVVPAPLVVGFPGDFDQDGDVDGGDFLRWQLHVGVASGATQAQGSADGDGDVDRYDLIEWKQGFGDSAAAAAGFSSSSSALSAGEAPVRYERTASASQLLPLASGLGAETLHSFATALRGPGGLGAGLTASTPAATAGQAALDRIGSLLSDAGYDAERGLRKAHERLLALDGVWQGSASAVDDSTAGVDRRDLALDDLFGEANGGKRTDSDLALQDDVRGFDAAFAELAAQVDWPRR
jgi:subtilisin family serine protease